MRLNGTKQNSAQIILCMNAFFLATNKQVTVHAQEQNNASNKKREKNVFVERRKEAGTAAGTPRRGSPRPQGVKGHSS